MKRRGATLIELLISIVAAAAVMGLFGGGCLGCHGLTSSVGFQDGQVQSLSNTGIIMGTNEGELASTGGYDITLEFSVWDESVMNNMETIDPGQNVRLFYRKHRFVWPWTGSTAYEVHNFEVLE